jgi:hypothetical protein
MPSELSEMHVRGKYQLSSYKSQDEAQPRDEKIFRSEVLSVALVTAPLPGASN